MTTAQPLDLTISIVSHGHGTLLAALLDDLRAQEGIATCHVIVTLNLADEPFDEKRFEGLKLTTIRNAEPAGFGANHNAAFAHCRTRWFLVLNPDIRLSDRTALARLLPSRDSSAPVPSLVAPVVTNSAGEVEDAVRTNLTPWSLLRRATGRDRTAALPSAPAIDRRFRWYAGMALAIDATMFQRIRGFDERFFLYCEDYDLCARIHRAGGALQRNADVVFVHDAQRDSHRSWRHLYWHLSSLLKVWTSSTYWYAVMHDRPR